MRSITPKERLRQEAAEIVAKNLGRRSIQIELVKKVVKGDAELLWEALSWYFDGWAKSYLSGIEREIEDKRAREAKARAAALEREDPKTRIGSGDSRMQFAGQAGQSRGAPSAPVQNQGGRSQGEGAGRSGHTASAPSTSGAKSSAPFKIGGGAGQKNIAPQVVGCMADARSPTEQNGGVEADDGLPESGRKDVASPASVSRTRGLDLIAKQPQPPLPNRQVPAHLRAKSAQRSLSNVCRHALLDRMFEGRPAGDWKVSEALSVCDGWDSRVTAARGEVARLETKEPMVRFMRLLCTGLSPSHVIREVRSDNDVEKFYELSQRKEAA